MAMHPRRLPLTFVAIAVAVVMAASPVAAAETGGLAGLLGGVHLGLGLGATAFSDLVPDGGGGETLVTTTYQKVSVSPDLAFGKFGLGLDLTFHFNFSGGATGDDYIRTEDWVPAEFSDTTATTGEKIAALTELYLGKFRYIRWGLRGEPLYIKLGMIDDGTLGNGFLMGNYANTLFLPEARIMGLAFGLDGSLFKFPLIGVETFFGNLARFDVLGGRLYVRPLSLTSVPILKNLAIGASAVVDRNPYLYAEAATEARPVVALGVDLQQPILSSPVVSLALMADWGMLTTASSADERFSGMGAMAGFGGKLIGFLTYGAQIRLLGPRFVPVYFDSMYDLVRADRYDLLVTAEAQTADWHAAWYGSIGTSFLKDSIVFNIGAGGPFRSPVLDSFGVPVVDNELNWPSVKGILKVEGDFLKGFSFLATYDKKNITKLADLISPLDALIQARLSYKTGPAVISFVYNLKYLPEIVVDELGRERQWEVSSGLETSIQLF